MELTKNNITLARLLLNSQKNYEENTDAIVPDTFPDILRIAAVYGSAHIKDDSPQAGRVLVSGTVHTTVFYCAEGGGLRKLDIPVSFAHIEEGSGITEDCQLFSTCRVISADAHVMNSRKLSVTVLLSLSCRVFCPTHMELSDGVSDADSALELLTTSQTVTVPAAVRRREFTLMEDVNLPDAARYESLSAPRCDLRLSDCRMSNEKAVVKGEAAIRMLAETTDGALESTDCVIPFTQIFEADGFDPSGQINVSFSLRHLDAELREDNTLSVGMGVCVLLTSFQTHTITSIADVYHLDHPVKTETRALCIPASRPLAEMGCEATETIPVGMKIAQIADVSAVLDTMIREPSRTSLRMMACIVYRAEDGEYYSVHRAVQMPLSLPDGVTDVQLIGMQCRASATISGQDSTVLALSGRVGLLCDESIHLNDLCELQIEDTVSNPRLTPVSVVLRYVDSEERLWDIAKCYRTTVDAIRQANQISAERPNAQSQMLLIPVR